MKKILNLIALILQTSIFLFGALVFITSILGFNKLQNTQASDIGTALGVGFGSVILLLFAIFSAIYSLVALVPFIMKLVRNFGRGRGFDIVAIVFDSLLIIVNAVLMVVSLESYALYIFVALLAVNIACIVLNSITVKYPAGR